MFEIGWSEILILGVVALVVVGPKELPVLLRTIGRYMGIVRKQASEFRRHFDDAMREAELDEIRRDVERFAAETNEQVIKAGQTVESALPQPDKAPGASQTGGS